AFWRSSKGSHDSEPILPPPKGEGRGEGGGAARQCCLAPGEQQFDRSKLFSIYLFSMGAPLFLGYWLFTFHSRVLANWIAASVLPLFCLMAVYWESRYRAGVLAVKGWLT